MANCRYCSAPVDRRKDYCDYCRARVEKDLHFGVEQRIYEPDSKRTCPDCNTTLTTIDLQVEGKFLIEKCNDCKGLFFDPGELEMLLDHTVSNVYHVDHDRLDELSKENFQARPKDFKYRKCPVCQVIMRRRNFGYKSAVIVDQCPSHGYWLDEGELSQLQNWRKAGGSIRQEKKEVEAAKQASARSERQPKTVMPESRRDQKDEGGFFGRGSDTLSNIFDLVDLFF